jgi:phage/conjugal plasmid C-4 type zinc finger TraR family protein
MFFDERSIETSELTQLKFSEGTIARIRDELAAEGEEVCVDCDDPIPAARRKALPSADRCIECQTRFERSRR